jgi:cytochrome c oxidase subunit 2
MPPDGALHGAALDRLMSANLLVFYAVFLLAHAILAVVLLRRAKSSSPEIQYAANSYIRWLTVALFCGLYAWTALAAERLWATSRFQGPSLTAMQVEVTGQQFQWYFRYPGPDATFGVTRPQLVTAPAGNPLGLDPRDPNSADDIVSSTLVLPAGREVDLRLRSLDVIHGFFIPGMRLKQNAVPGLLLHVHFTPATAGTYPILCSQVCGLGHARMQARLLVVSPAEFTTWLASHESGHAGLGAAPDLQPHAEPADTHPREAVAP